MPDPSQEAAITAIHAAPEKLVFAFTGAGSLALYWLHSVAGSSRTILEAIDCYSHSSLAELIGGAPSRAVDPETARQMAERARSRAAALAPGEPALGLGLTATIATDRLKRGEHRCYLALSAASTKIYGLTLTKGLRDREGEEQVIAALVIKALAEACGIQPPPLALAEGEVLETLSP
jgi:nicotinamide mononucleotide (NMN) deamidase PncC